MLRSYRSASGLAKAAFALVLSGALLAVATPLAQAYDPPFYSLTDGIKRHFRLVQRYVGASRLGARSNGRRRAGEAVVVMKLGMGIPFCKNHMATIAVRDGKVFRPIARARTLRGVRSRNIGLTAARLPAGTYYVVHGFCNVGRREFNVGLPTRGRRGRRAFKTAYAKFILKRNQVRNVGFLRFFPPEGRGGRLKILLQRTPARDIQFLARRYPRLRARLQSRLMARTRANGQIISGKRNASARRRVAVQRPRRPAAKPKVNRASPRITRPAITTPARPPARKLEEITPDAIPAAGSSTMTFAQRRAACLALFKLQASGKVERVPANCNSFKPAANSKGLPPASGPDK